jgi:hypothetical protein
MTNANDYKRFRVETFASHEGLMAYTLRLARMGVAQLSVRKLPDGLWEVSTPYRFLPEKRSA